MSLNITCLSCVSLFVLACRSGEPAQYPSDEVVPLSGRWTTSDMTYVSDCEDMDGGSFGPLSFLESTLDTTVPEQTELSYDISGQLEVHPDTLERALQCTFFRGQFTCPEMTIERTRNHQTFLLKRSLEGIFYADSTSQSTPDRTVYANTGEFFVTAEWRCKDEHCGREHHLECDFETHFTVTAYGGEDGPFDTL